MAEEPDPISQENHMPNASCLIRDERPDDIDAIRSVVERAFAHHPHSQQTEHIIVRELRIAGQLILPKVGMLDGKIIGYATFSPVRLSPDHDGWYGLGPVAVDPVHQGVGFGSMLIESALEQLKRGGACGCVVLGEPRYYSRFGFVPEPNLTLEGVPPEYFLAQTFIGSVPAARVSYHAAFSASA
jgi:putative acetyltransferase